MKYMIIDDYECRNTAKQGDKDFALEAAEKVADIKGYDSISIETMFF